MNTQRYSSEQRNEALDEFLTPPALIEACFEKVIVPYYVSAPLPDIILDVGANDGRWGKVARKYFPKATIMGVELMTMPKPDEYDEWVNADFIETRFLPLVDLVIGNPPFTVKEKNEAGELQIKYKAEDFVWQALKCLSPHGRIYFLLRSNFRHSQERHAKLFKEHHYQQVWELDRRPSFYRGDHRTKYFGKTNTNAHDYSLFVWYNSWRETYGISRPLAWDY